MKSVLLFAGSNSPKSINQSLAVFVSGLIKQTKSTVINLRDYPLPIYSIEIEQIEEIPENVRKLKKIFDEHDTLVISIAENNGSVTAFFKNALDWLSRIERNYKILSNKSVLLLSASPGSGGASALTHAETILKRLGAIVIGKIVVNNFYQRVTMVDGEIQIKEVSLLKEITEMTTKLIC